MFTKRQFSLGNSARIFITHITILEKVIKVQQKQIYHIITMHLMIEIGRSSNLFLLSNLDFINSQFSYILFC